MVSPPISDGRGCAPHHPGLGGTPRPPVLDAGERKSTVWRLDSRWKRDTAKPRSLGCGASRGLEGQDERSPCNLSLSTILFAPAKGVSHFPERHVSHPFQRDFRAVFGPFSEQRDDFAVIT